MKQFSLFACLLGICSMILLYVSWGIFMIALKNKKPVSVIGSSAVCTLIYIIVQCISIYCFPVRADGLILMLSERFMSLPEPVIILLMCGIVCILYILRREQMHFAKTQMTGASVKEGIDNLPSGICIYMDGGRILMVNKAMEDFAHTVSGEVLISGEKFSESLMSGKIRPECSFRLIGDIPVIALPEGSVWAASFKTSVYDSENVHILKVSEVTELYRKTESLRQMQERLSELNVRLNAYNNEIVKLTAEKELLQSRLNIHDEMGTDLLRIRRYIKEGGTEKEREEIRERLKVDLSFLLRERSQVRDEYDLMIETSEKLGVHVRVEGKLPEESQLKHVVASAIHECFTNAIRHAHGNALFINCEETESGYWIAFRNNGTQPEQPVIEKGGLLSLRKLAEFVGGGVTVSVNDGFTVTLILPKEEITCPAEY